MKNIISQVAEKNGVSYEEVYEDMKQAILAGFHSDDPEVKKAWSSIPFSGSEPTPEEVIKGISHMLAAGS